MNPLSTMGTKQMCVSELDDAIGPGAGGKEGAGGEGCVCGAEGAALMGMR